MDEFDDISMSISWLQVLFMLPVVVAVVLQLFFLFAVCEASCLLVMRVDICVKHWDSEVEVEFHFVVF